MVDDDEGQGCAMSPAIMTGTVRMSELTLRSARYPEDDGPAAQRSGPLGQPVRARRPRKALRERRPLSRRRLAASAVICTMLCSLIARPANADPGATIPDVGLRPVPTGP